MNHCTKFHQNLSTCVKIMGLRSSTNQVAAKLLRPVPRVDQGRVINWLGGGGGGGVTRAIGAVST